jgi:hypothetical protein
MIEVSDATALAKNFVVTMFPDAVGVRLEEVELGEREEAWNVTVSFIPPDRSATYFETITGNEGRLFKTVKMDANTGVVKSMKIRTLG